MKTYRLLLILMLTSISFAPATHAALQMTSTNNVVLGGIYNDFTNTNYYHFVNNGTTTVQVVRLIPTCTCILATNDVNILRPGEKMKVSVSFHARGIHGEFSRGLWVVTDEPVNNQTLLRVSGEVIPLFKGFPEERISLLGKDNETVFTNQFIFTATTTNYFLGHPQCEELTKCIAFQWDSKKIGSTNVWYLTSVIKPTGNMSKFVNIRVPVTGPTETSDRFIRMKLTVGVELMAAPSKLVTTTLTQPLIRKIYLVTYLPNAQVELLTWQPQMDGITVKKTVPQTRGTLKHQKISRVPKLQGSRTRFECTVTITPAALQELIQMDEPAITFSYPDHQPVTIPIILYEGTHE